MSIGSDLSTSRSDYFRQIVYASDLKRIYFNTVDAPFPPFAYMFYHLLFLINPFDAPIVLDSYRIAQQQGSAMHIYYLLLAIKIVLFYYAIFINLKDQYKKTTILLFTTLVILSAPILFGCIEKGNVIFLVFSLLLIANKFRDSDNYILKEIALILIAISAAIKVYPALFGLVYIKQKRYKEAMRLILYGLLFFFLPFIFVGGIKGFIQYLNILKYFQNNTIPRWTSISPTIFAIFQAINPSVNLKSLLPLCIVSQSLFLIINLLSFFKCKEEYKFYFFLCGILSLYVPDSYRYTSAFMIVPFLSFMNKEDFLKKDFVYFVCFCLVFVIPMYAYFLNITIIDFCLYAPIYVLTIYAYFDLWILKNR